MGIISGAFRKILIVIFTILFMLAELFTMTLYTLSSSTQNEILYEIARNIDLRQLTGSGEESSEGQSLEGAFDELKKGENADKLDGIETVDDLIATLPDTQALREYIGSIVTSFISGGEKRISFAELKGALLDAIEEIPGLDAEDSDELRNFASTVIDTYSYELFNRMLDAAGAESIMDSLGVDGDCVELVDTLLQERTRRISVVVCAALALLLLWICKGSGHWLSGLGSFIGCAGAASMLSGAVFLVAGYFNADIAGFIDKTQYYYISPLLIAFEDEMLIMGRRALYPGTVAALVYVLFFKKTNRD